MHTFCKVIAIFCAVAWVVTPRTPSDSDLQEMTKRLESALKDNLSIFREDHGYLTPGVREWANSEIAKVVRERFLPGAIEEWKQERLGLLQSIANFALLASICALVSSWRIKKDVSNSDIWLSIFSLMMSVYGSS